MAHGLQGHFFPIIQFSADRTCEDLWQHQYIGIRQLTYSDVLVPGGVRLQLSVVNPHPSLPGSGYGLQLQILNEYDKVKILYVNTRPLQ